jgi:hypothetical protein
LAIIRWRRKTTLPARMPIRVRKPEGVHEGGTTDDAGNTGGVVEGIDPAKQCAGTRSRGTKIRNQEQVVENCQSKWPSEEEDNCWPGDHLKKPEQSSNHVILA